MSPRDGPALCKYDRQSGARRARLGQGDTRRRAGVRAGVPPKAGEDEGWVISLAHDTTSDESRLLIIDAQEISRRRPSRRHIVATRPTESRPSSSKPGARRASYARHRPRPRHSWPGSSTTSRPTSPLAPSGIGSPTATHPESLRPSTRRAEPRRRRRADRSPTPGHRRVGSVTSMAGAEEVRAAGTTGGHMHTAHQVDVGTTPRSCAASVADARRKAPASRPRRIRTGRFRRRLAPRSFCQNGCVSVSEARPRSRISPRESTSPLRRSRRASERCRSRTRAGNAFRTASSGCGPDVGRV